MAVSDLIRSGFWGVYQKWSFLTAIFDLIRSGLIIIIIIIIITRAVSNGATIFHFKTQKMALFSNGRWTLHSEVIKKDEYDESVHSSSRPLLSDSTHRERYYESSTHHVNTPKRTGAYCCLPQVGCCFCCCCQV